MKKFAVVVLFIGVMLLAAVAITSAQDNPAPAEPQPVEVTAVDGVALLGDFYAVSDAAAPTVILLHQAHDDRHIWDPFIPTFLENGFNVLAVDQRGNGKSAGDRDLVAAIGDVQIWLDWLREQPSVEDNTISTIGSSWGTTPALAGCAADANCLTAIAISPADFPMLDEAMFASMSERSVLFIIGRKDSLYANTQALLERSAGEAVMYVANTPSHGLALLSSRSTYKTDVTKLILDWLNTHVEQSALLDEG